MNIKNNVNNVKNMNISESTIRSMLNEIRSTKVESKCSIKSCTTITSPSGVISGQFISSNSKLKLEGGNLVLQVTSSNGGDMRIRISYRALKRLVQLGVKLWNAYMAFYSIFKSVKTEMRRSMKNLMKSGDIKVTKNF